MVLIRNLSIILLFLIIHILLSVQYNLIAINNITTVYTSSHTSGEKLRSFNIRQCRVKINIAGMSAPKSLLHPEQGTGEKSLPKSTSLPRQPSNGEISCPSNASHSKASQMSHWSTTPQVSGPEYRAYSSNGDDLQASARLDAPTTSLLQPSFVMSRFQSETPKESSNRVFGSYMTKGTRDAADIESEATHTFMASGDLANTAQKKK